MCPLCALTGLTTWMLAGGVGGSCAATAAVYWRRRKLSAADNSTRGTSGSIGTPAGTTASTTAVKRARADQSRVPVELEEV